MIVISYRYPPFQTASKRENQPDLITHTFQAT